jgi:hypothetical protein
MQWHTSTATNALLTMGGLLDSMMRMFTPDTQPSTIATGWVA